MASSRSLILNLSFPDEFSLEPEYKRFAWVHDWCQSFLLPALTSLPPNLKHFFGEDFARSGDLTGIWVLTQDQHLKLHSPLIVEIRNCPFEQQKQILFFVIARLPRFQAGALDARGNGSSIAEACADKFGRSRIKEIMPSQEWYHETMPLLKSCFEDHEICVPQDDDVLSDLRSIKIVRGVAKVPEDEKNRGTDGKWRHGDTAIALAMAIYAVFKMEPAPIEFTAVPDSLERWSPKEANGFNDYNDNNPDFDIGCY